MEWLILIGIMALIFGLIFIASHEVLVLLGDSLNRPVAYIDEKLKSVRVISGIIQVIIGGWVISVAFAYPELWYLHLIGVTILFFVLLYLFLPEWLDWLSQVLNQLLLSTDEMVVGARKSLGIILIVGSVYIFYSAYLMNR
jgi:hypothetical protein